MEKKDIIQRVNSIDLDDIEKLSSEYQKFTKVIKFVSSCLPSGYIRRIQAITGENYSASYINQFFNLRYNVTKSNIVILEAAIDIILEDIEAFEKVKEKIVKTLK